MKIKELFEYNIQQLNVDDSDKSVDEYEEYIKAKYTLGLNKIKNECSEIINIYKKSQGNFLYRGITLSSDLENSFLLSGEIRSNRIRTDNSISEENTKLINNSLAKLGITARRDNSLFCATAFYTANGYGSGVYVIFPKNGFEYTWFLAQSPEEEYVWTYLKKIVDTWNNKNINYNEYNTPFKKDMLAMDKANFFLEQIESLGPTQSNLVKALTSNKEVLISGSNGYYAMLVKRHDTGHLKDVLDTI